MTNVRVHGKVKPGWYMAKGVWSETCEKRVGHPITANGIYARLMFPEKSFHKAVRIVTRAGGAEKLKALSPEAQRILLGIRRSGR